MQGNKGLGYTYADAGFNGFFRRTLSSNRDAQTLSAVGRSGQSSGILNFDQLKAEGSLGDMLKVGLVTINGRDGRIEFNNQNGELIGEGGVYSE